MIYILILVLVVCSALFSGLTIGLMGLDLATLKRKMDLGDANARKIYPIRKNGNLLLTTLLLGNVAVNAILSVLLANIATGIIASIVSISLIFIFGEILPQAVFSRYALPFGARTAWIVQILFFILYPITWPIAFLLDKLLGQEIHYSLSKKELVHVIDEQPLAEHTDSLDSDEKRIARGALLFSNKKVGDVMTPRTVTVTVASDDILDTEKIQTLKLSGHSRFPVSDAHDNNNIIGMLYIKDLIGLDSDTSPVVETVMDREVYFVSPKEVLDNVFNEFLKTRVHLFMVRDEFGMFLGVISIEDIVEEIVGTEIVDEFDTAIDMRSEAIRKNTKK